MKFTIILVIIIVTMAGCGLVEKPSEKPGEMVGVSVASQTFCFCNRASYSFSNITNAYAIITDIKTGNMYDLDNATPLVTTTWTEAAIPFATDLQNTDWACATIPVLDNEMTYAMVVYENANPVLGDTIKIPAFLFDPQMGGYTDTNPLIRKKVRVETAR